MTIRAIDPRTRAPQRARAGARPRPALPSLGALATMVLGCVALASRDWSRRSLLVIVLVGVAGVAARIPLVTGRGRAGARRWLVVTGAGVAAFAVVASMSPPIPIAPFTRWALFANVLAAICEEAFFRRFAYGHLERFGAPVAVGLTALGFAIVHVPVWGAPVFWLDLGAGLVLGWQRWASGGWSAPATTHALANVLMMR